MTRRKRNALGGPEMVGVLWPALPGEDRYEPVPELEEWAARALGPQPLPIDDNTAPRRFRAVDAEREAQLLEEGRRLTQQQADAIRKRYGL